MKSIKIHLIIKNVDTPYEYKGTAKEYNDIIEFNDQDTNYIFDETIKRLTKSNKKNTIIVDFKNKEIIIKEKENNLKINITIIKEIVKEKKIHYSYKIDNNNFDFILEKEV